MANASRYMAAWFKRGLNYQDPFDRFIALWIAMAICARSRDPAKHYSSDAPAVRDWLVVHANAVSAIMPRTHPLMRWFAARRGPDLGQRIIDHPEKWVRDSMDALSYHIEGVVPLSVEDAAKYLGNLMIAVRNNLFHGEKDPHRVTDAELVDKVGEALVALLRGVDPRFS